jgi:AcrR family transcriptional regulator
MADGETKRSSADRIIDEATRQFASRGYHAVSIRDLARAVDLSVSTVAHHIGSKEKLYESIFDRLNELSRPLAEQVQIARQILNDNPPALPALIDLFMDGLITMAHESPYNRQLWIRLLLELPEEFARREAEVVAPLQVSVIGLFHDCRKHGIIKADEDTIRFFVASIDWLLDGFFLGGTLGEDGKRSDPSSPEEQARFAKYLKHFARSVLVLQNLEPTSQTTDSGSYPLSFS